MKQIHSAGTFARIVLISALLLPLCGCLSSYLRVLQPGGSAKADQSGLSRASQPADVAANPEPLPKTADPQPVRPLAPPAAVEELPTQERLPVISHGDTSYENTTLTEDVTWRGTVLIRGWLVIAPQATVRIEPGTVVRFMKSPIMRQTPLLVVQGRIHCGGTPDSPVIFTSNYEALARGDWGGILLLSSGKRNLFEYVRIEGAKTGLEAHFSTLLAKGVTITNSAIGMLLRDTTATLSAVDVNGCATAIESHDSEVELRESSLVNNRRGIVARDSTLVLLSLSLRNNREAGLVADRCRIRLSSCELSANAGGARISGGEGQISGTRFTGNSGVGLHLSAARIRVQQCLFADTAGDGIRVDDGRSLVWNCAFGGNSGYNLVNAGQEEISAVQNWWGSSQEELIRAKLSAAGQGPINIAPWLTEKPEALP